MVVKDIMTKGFIAGLTGGIFMNLISYFSYYLGITDLRFLDWPGIIITGHIPSSTFSLVFFLLVQLIFVGFLGSIFALLIYKLVTKTNIFFKSILFSLLSWFAIYGMTYIAGVPRLTPLTMGTAITDFTGAIAYGIVLAEVLIRLDTRIKLS